MGLSKNKAVFLDRDGVINKRKNDYIKSIKEFEFLPNVPNAIRKLNQMKYLVIIITNQSVIDREIITEEKLNEIHEYMHNKLRNESCEITKIYFCPHKPDRNCNCRKPKPGLLFQAIKDFDVNISESWLIGDSDSDILAATKIGLKSIKIERKLDLLDAVTIIQSS